MPDQINSQDIRAPECELTVLMPCLNEAETIGTCVEKAMRSLERAEIDGEVLISDNGSTDGSQEIAEKLGARVIHASERGYGAALKAGIAVARGRFVIMGDADDSYDFTALDPFVEKLREGNDLVMGNRFRGGIEKGAMPFLHRYFGNPVLSFLGRLFFKAPVGDIYCGLRGFDRDAIRGLALTASGMEFANEMVVKSTLQGLRIAEVPTTLSPDGRSKRPHLRTWRDGWRTLRFLLMFSPRWLFLYPGLLLMAIGLASMLWLLPGTRTIGNVGFDVNTLVYSGAAIILGFQAIVFSLFAKIFAMGAGLLPEDPRMDKLRSLFTLEVGIIVGLLVLLGGFAAFAYAIGFWGRASFGELDVSQSLRIVAPSATALVLGLQIIFSSFFISVLDLKRR
jgi:glycosyltransferase involved in cell wall biosynthesis